MKLIVEKAGVNPDETLTLVKYINEECPHLQFTGLMTIGSASSSHAAEEEQRNPDFEVFSTSHLKLIRFYFTLALNYYDNYRN